MYHRLYRIIFTLIFLVDLYAHDVLQVNFNRLSADDGLASNAVECIHQDHRGYIWLATQDGLSRYDGYSFTNYKHDPNDSSSISNNIVYHVFDDGRYLWIGTAGKLNRFDPESGQFRTAPVYAVSSIVKDNRGIIWAASLAHGLYGLDAQMNIVYHLTAGKGQLSFDYIRDLLYDVQGDLWVGTEGGGVTRISFLNDSLHFKYYTHDVNDNNSIISDSVTSVCRDGEGNYWFGTRRRGLDLLTKSGTFKHFLHREGAANSLPSNEIRTVVFDAFSNSIWVGTYNNGMCRLKQNSKGAYTIEPVKSDRFNRGILSDNSVTSIFIDRFSSLWKGTYHSGVYTCTLPRMEFETYKSPNSTIGPHHGAGFAWTFYEDAQKRVWAGGINGVCLLPQKGSAKKTPKSWYFKGSKEIQVRRILKDRQGTLWAATIGAGLVKLSLNKNVVKFTAVEYPYQPEGSHLLYGLEADRGNDSLLWLGSNGAGLIKYNKYSGQTVFYKVNHVALERPGTLGWVCAIYQDREGILWLGTWNNGLCRFNPASGEIIHFIKSGTNSLNNNTVLAIHAFGDSVLWLGTYGGGLNRFDIKRQTFRSYTTADGLPNNVIYSIVEDNRHNLWLSTNVGIAFFRPSDGSVKNFTIDDGLPGNEFNLGAGFKNSQGDIFFGSSEGIVRFKPLEVINPWPPQLRLTAFKKYGHVVKFPKPLNQMAELHLGYRDKVFSFEFVGLHYKNSAQNHYAYMLEGRDDDWIYCGTKRKASFQNLSPGKYVFKVKAANCDGVWTKQALEIPLIITPPLWHNPWVYLLAFILMGAVLFSLHRLRLRQILRIETAKLYERERLRRKMAADFHDELGHRVTKISLLSKIALNEAVGNGKPVKPLLHQIAENADGLFTEMKEFVWELDPQKDSLYDLMSQLKNFSGRLFDATHIAFQIEGLNTELEDLKLNMDWRQNLLRLFKEGMTNILKHAADCNNVRLQVICLDGHLRITLSDDGAGFDINSVAEGNGLKNMQNRARAINGNLQIESKPGRGTKLMFTGKLS